MCPVASFFFYFLFSFSLTVSLFYLASPLLSPSLSASFPRIACAVFFPGRLRCCVFSAAGCAGRLGVHTFCSAASVLRTSCTALGWPRLALLFFFEGISAVQRAGRRESGGLGGGRRGESAGVQEAG